jgi:hypothetical protein
MKPIPCPRASQNMYGYMLATLRTPLRLTECRNRNEAHQVRVDLFFGVGKATTEKGELKTLDIAR